MNNEVKEKTCKNCKHYAPYYTILNARLCNAEKGICRNTYAHGKQRKTGKPCGEWQQDAEIEEKYEKSFRSILEKIAASLNELALIVNRKKENE